MVGYKIFFVFVVLFSLQIKCSADMPVVPSKNITYDSDSSENELGMYFSQQMSFDLVDSKNINSSQFSLRGSSGLGIKLEEIADRKKVTVRTSKKDIENKDSIVITSKPSRDVVVTSVYSCKRKKNDEIIVDNDCKYSKKTGTQYDSMQKDLYENHIFYNSYGGYFK